MKYLEFKNYLINNDIIFFDYDYRIAYNNLLDLNTSLFKEQKGGGDYNYISPFLIIKREEKTKRFNLLIRNLVNSNINGAKFVCQNNLVLF